MTYIKKMDKDKIAGSKIRRKPETDVFKVWKTDK